MYLQNYLQKQLGKDNSPAYFCSNQHNQHDEQLVPKYIETEQGSKQSS